MFESFASISVFDKVADQIDRLRGRHLWPEAEAEIVSVQWVSDFESGGSWSATYSYKVGEGHYSGRIIVGDSPKRPRYKAGEILAVRYNPRHPSQKYVSSLSSGHESYFLAFLGIIALLIVVAACAN